MNERKILVMIFLLALVLRIGGNAVKERVFFKIPFLFFGEAYKNTIREDALWYDGTARAFLAGKGAVSMHVRDHTNKPSRMMSVQHRMIDDEYYAHTSIPPLYPVLLGLCYAVGGFNTLSYLIPNAVMGSLTCIFIYLLGKEIFDRRTAVVAGVAAAAYPDLVFWVNVVSPQILFMFLLVIGFFLITRGNARKSAGMVYMSGVFFGLGCLARITLIPFIPVFFIWETVFFSENRKLNLRVGAMTVLIVGMFLLPWSMRNYVVFGEFTPFTSETKVVLWSTDKPDRDIEAERYCRLYKSAIIRTAMFIRDNFKEYIAISAKRFIKFWSPYTASMRPPARAYRCLTWLVIFPPAFYAMALSLKKYRRKTGLLIAFILFHSLLHAASYVEEGLVYRYAIQPFLCVFAAYGFWTIHGKIKTYFCYQRAR